MPARMILRQCKQQLFFAENMVMECDQESGVVLCVFRCSEINILKSGHGRRDCPSTVVKKH
jgi:hypothetical protein